jgi:hypothetical protein
MGPEKSSQITANYQYFQLRFWHGVRHGQWHGQGYLSHVASAETER